MTGGRISSRQASRCAASRGTRPGTHIAWAQVLDIDYPLLSDWNGEAVRGLDIEHVYRGMSGVFERAAFLIDGSGVVRGAWRFESSEVPDFDVLLEAARNL